MTALQVKFSKLATNFKTVKHSNKKVYYYTNRHGRAVHILTGRAKVS